MGNPCSAFQGYRDYVVVTLPQLKVSPAASLDARFLQSSRGEQAVLGAQWLDGAEISRSHRIRASQRLEELTRRLWEQEEEHLERRRRERQEAHEKAERGVTSRP